MEQTADFPLVPENLRLGPLAAGTRILPCLTHATAPAHQFALTDDRGATCALAPAGRFPAPLPSTSAQIRAHVDWFEILADQSDVRMCLHLAADKLPTDALICLSMRAPAGSGPLPTLHPKTQRILEVPPISQMEGPLGIRKHICSAACVTMALLYHGLHPSLPEIAAATRHPMTGLFGVWPINMQVAASHGLDASVSYCQSLTQVAALIDLGLPTAVSIRYKSGQLPGAPVHSSGGHLVVLRGMDSSLAYVQDPGAESADSVARSYDLSAFAASWYNHHRIAYLIAPVRSTT